MWRLYEGDCLEIMPTLPEKSVDMILCDLPYGTTACAWDTIIPFEPLWKQYERLIKDNGAIALTASQPFTTFLISSNFKLFKYELIWLKNIATGYANANRKPMAAHENILIFYNKPPVYNPQFYYSTPYVQKRKPKPDFGEFLHSGTKRIDTINTDGKRYPTTQLYIDREVGCHPTQKPVALFEYLIRTYTNPGDTVLDNCAGSGTTGVAAEQCGRNSILIEREPKYCDIIRKRMKVIQPSLFNDISV